MAQDRRLTVTCRQARPADKPDMLEITRTIWEGRDYVPRVWDEWLADSSGRLGVAEYNGRVLGVGKLTRLTDRDWWLEGLRVHPEFERRGIATQLHEYLTATWQDTGSGALRLATSAERIQVHRLCARSGFTQVGERVIYQSASLGDGEHLFHAIESDDVEAALRVISTNRLVGFQNWLMDLGWQWAAPDRELLLGTIEGQRAFWWKGARTDSLLLYWEDEPNEYEPDQTVTPTIQLVACPLESLTDCLLDFRRLAGAQGFENAAWVAPYRQEMISALEGAGYERRWEGSLVLFESNQSY